MSNDNNNNDKPKKTISLDELMALEGITIDPFSQIKEAKTAIPGKKKPFPTSEELKEAKKENKFYLPVLSLNDESQWETKPNSERRNFTDEIATQTCLSNCCGKPGVYSACCRLDPDDLEHILGPVSEDWIKYFIGVSKKKGWNYKREDIVIDFEEGKLIGEQFFNGHLVFTRPTSYPMMRLQTMGPRLACKFLNPHNGKCTIYQYRPDPMCTTYLCQYVKKNFFIKTKEKPNTWLRVDVGNKEKE